MSDFPSGTGLSLPKESRIDRILDRAKRVFSVLFSAGTTAFLIYLITSSFTLSLSLFLVLLILAFIGLIQIGIINILPRSKIVFGIINLFYFSEGDLPPVGFGLSLININLYTRFRG